MGLRMAIVTSWAVDLNTCLDQELKFQKVDKN
jgi:hypothetical protein